MTAEMIRGVGILAGAAIGFAQLFVIWRGLRRWEQAEAGDDTRQLLEDVGRRLAARSEMLKDVGRRLDASTARLGEELAKGRA